MPRPKGSKLTKEHKAKLRESALRHIAEKRKLEENDREINRTSNNEDAREKHTTESNISGQQDNIRESEPETLEIEKGALANMEIPPKKPLDIKEPEATPEKFTCANCQGDLTMGTKFCPHCGCQLDWSVAS
jgi:hypothetical protein